MAGPSWLVDSSRIATKIRSASGLCDPGRVNWKSNPTRACPNCEHIIDNSDVTQEWPGLPRGVKFDPSDQEIIWHLLAKVSVGNMKPHPFIEEFIPTVNEDDGICYTHPQNLPGVKQDGSVSHFFHRAIKAYNTGTRKRRKIHGDDFGDVRWHKTGRTKPVNLDGVQKGCKKIMVLYVGPPRGGKPEKTNWVMHQYHLGTGEDEKEGEYVISKVFYQQQVKQTDKFEQDLPEGIDVMIVKVDPVTPKSVTPEPPRTERRFSNFDPDPSPLHHEIGLVEDDVQIPCGEPNHQGSLVTQIHTDQMPVNIDNQTGEDPKWWDGESQYLLDSQQLVEVLSLCDEFLRSQSPNRDGSENGESKGKSLSDYAHLGPEDLKKDLEVCQDLVLDPANIDLDTPPDFRLSQLEFGSQDSFLAWGN
ncbi:SUPPRESSOR OF GAMMA RESPONSE 1 [Camellia lanceoleosa]|uniref:SUPPRESSOR OF GAMMA RESPONSE 1 n=1 Tax=Camellia lanceoleosa TaxID=1840588 RepID=A0ACC0GAP0_9ERIC|nr:SUPPRESSOR OF GAMMA RESPONSE 1 [Camellia lanceoleosa]